MTDPKNLPPEVVALLKKGDKIGAMKLMLQNSKGGGMIGKTVVEALESRASYDMRDQAPRPSVGAPRASPPGYVKRDGLSPGEVPRTNGALEMVIFVAAIVSAIWLYLTFG